jgi:UDP-glucose 4-epimerase
MNKNRAVIVGGAGFLGSYLIKQCLGEGFEVVCADTETTDYSRVDGLPITIIKADITKPETLAGIFQPGDWVFHLVGILGAAYASKETYELVNIQGTLHVLNQAIADRAEKFIFISSIGAIGPVGSVENPLTELSECQPADDYDWSKFEAEKRITDTAKGKITSVIVRAPVIFGPQPNSISTTAFLFNYAQKKQAFLIGDGRVTMPICYVGNLAEALVYLARYHVSDVHTYLYADEEPHTLREILEYLSTCFESNTKYFELPVRPLKFLVAVAERAMPLFGKRSPLTMDLIKGMTENVYFYDISKLASTGFKPSRTLYVGLEETVTWMKLHLATDTRKN